MIKFLFYFIVFSAFLQFHFAQISDKRLCFDPECNSPISSAKTLGRYLSPDKYRLSFGPNEDVVIFSKSAGSDENLWGAEIKGKRGYVPKNLVRETKKIKHPTLLVDTEITKAINEPQVPSKEEIVEPSKVKQSFEVLDGTTIYMTAENSIYNENKKYFIETSSESLDSSHIDNFDTADETENLSTTEDFSDADKAKDILKTDSVGHNLQVENSVTESSNVTSDHGSSTGPITNPSFSSQMKESLGDGRINETTASLSETGEEVILNENEEFPTFSRNDEQVQEDSESTVFNDIGIKNNGISSTEQSNLENEQSNFENEVIEFGKESVNIDLLEILNTTNAGGEIEVKKDPINVYTEISINDFSNFHKSAKPENSPTPLIEDANPDDVRNNGIGNLVKRETSSIEIQTESESTTEMNFNAKDETLANGETLSSENIQQKHIQNVERNFAISNDQDETSFNAAEGNLKFEIKTGNNLPIRNEDIQDAHKDIHDSVTDEEMNDNLNNISTSDISDSQNIQGHNLQEDTLTNQEQIPIMNNTDTLTDDIVSDLQDLPKQNLQEATADSMEIIEKTSEGTPTVHSDFVHNLDNEYKYHDEENTQIRSNMDAEVPYHSNSLNEDDFCTKEDCPNQAETVSKYLLLFMDMLNFSSEFFLYLVTTAISVIIFLLGHFALDKSRRESPLIAKINELEKEFLILLKENEMLVEQVDHKTNPDKFVESEDFLNLQHENETLIEKIHSLEEQIQTLEKELENSTEVGLELNRMLSEVLNGENAGQTLMLNVEGLQAQLAEQQNIVSNMKELLSLKDTQNHELNLDLDIANKKITDFQSELDKLLLQIIKLEEDKESQKEKAELEMVELKELLNSFKNESAENKLEYIKKIEELSNDLSTTEHHLQLKIKEYDGLKKRMQQIKEIKNANTLESIFEVNSIKAELEQLKSECKGHCDKLRSERETNSILEMKLKSSEEEKSLVKLKFDDTDKAKLELETKLQILTNYFKEKEEQLQKELSKYENMWSTKRGEATSTSERIKHLQSEVQNYKAQNETLKQEIVSQEVELKGQISILEKKVHENWVSARQAERRLEELKQEAAQLRNKLTLRERALQDDRLHNRMQSPLEAAGDIPVSPLHLESPASPPILYSSRDHITKSPPILGMPPPFLPPPASGSSYLPPPPLPFMPPPPHDMFPGDHRPPPLGRISSPPLNARYSPNRGFSPYDRSPSPYDESEYGTSPVHRRNYSQFSRRREHRPAAMEKLNGRSGTMSSGSDNSNESVDEINKHNLKV